MTAQAVSEDGMSIKDPSCLESWDDHDSKFGKDRTRLIECCVRLVARFYSHLLIIRGRGRARYRVYSATQLIG